MTRRKMRKPVQVRGVVMENGDIVNEGEGDIVSVYRNTDNTAYYLDDANNEHRLVGKVISYTSRFL